MTNVAPPAVNDADEYAGFWIRLWASIIDSLLVAVIIGPAIWAIYGPEYFDMTGLVAGPADFLLSWVFPAVGVVAFWIVKSATPGKMATRIRIVDAATGGPPSTRQCIVRYVAYFASLLPFAAGFLWVAIDARKQGWHDKLAGTVVLRRRGERTSA